MQTRLSIEEFAEKYLDIKIFPHQANVVAALLEDQTVALMGATGVTTCKRVANEIIVRRGKVDRGGQFDMVIFDELATANCTECGVEAFYWTATDSCEHKLIREKETA